MKKLFFLVSILSLWTNVIFSQSVQISGVRKAEFRGVQGIKNKGYYTFYVNEKVGRGLVEFMLEIYDLELNVIKKTPIQISKHSVLIGGEFNGEDFLFAFSDVAKHMNTYVTVDASGMIIKQENVIHKKVQTAGSTEIYPSNDGDGFYITSTVKEKKWGYCVQKVDRNLSTLWEKTVSKDHGMVGIESAESGNGELLLITTERPTLLSKKITGKIVCFDGKSGNAKYEYSLYDGTITGIPSAFLIDKQGNVVTAGMYFEGEKWDNTNSDGIFFLKLNSKGEKIAYNTIDWDKGIQSALKATSRKFSIGSKPKVLFHEIVESPDGGYQIVSETFRKTVKAGTVLAVMAGNNSNDIPIGFTVMDYIIFNYDKNGKPLDINKIEKPYKSITIDGSIANQGGVRLAAYLKRYKMFTFEFATKLSTGEQVIVYSNFEDDAIATGKPYVGITSIGVGQESKTTKIPLERKLARFISASADSRTGALEGKSGKVCVYFYDGKTKTINLAMEDLKL